MELTLKSLFEPLDITIDTGRGTRTVSAEVDVRPTSLARLSRICIDAGNKMGAIEALSRKGRDERNPEAVAKSNDQTGAILREVLSEAIGPDVYEEVLAACGNGRPMTDGDCTPVTSQVFHMVLDIVKARTDKMGEKAAHYLPEESHAQTEPDAAAQ